MTFDGCDAVPQLMIWLYYEPATLSALFLRVLVSAVSCSALLSGTLSQAWAPRQVAVLCAFLGGNLDVWLDHEQPWQVIAQACKHTILSGLKETVLLVC